jgi:hypothetical protein
LIDFNLRKSAKNSRGFLLPCYNCAEITAGARRWA